MFSLLNFYLSISWSKLSSLTVLILSDKISEHIRNKSYKIITHSAVEPKMTNCKSM